MLDILAAIVDILNPKSNAGKAIVSILLVAVLVFGIIELATALGK